MSRYWCRSGGATYPPLPTSCSFCSRTCRPTELGAPHMFSSWLRKRTGMTCPTSPAAALRSPLMIAHMAASKDTDVAVLICTITAATGLSVSSGAGSGNGGGGMLDAFRSVATEGGGPAAGVAGTGGRGPGGKGPGGGGPGGATRGRWWQTRVRQVG